MRPADIRLGDEGIAVARIDQSVEIDIAVAGIDVESIAIGDDQLAVDIDLTAGRIHVDGRSAADIEVAADQSRDVVNGLRCAGAECHGTPGGADAVVEDDHPDAVVGAVVVVRPQIHVELARAARIGDGLIDDDGVGRLQRQSHRATGCFRNGSVDGNVAQRTARTSGGDGDVVAAGERRGNSRRQNRRIARARREIGRRITVSGRGAADDDVVRIKQPFTGETRGGRCIGRDAGHVQPVTGGFDAAAVAALGAALGEQRAIHARRGIGVVHL